MLRLDIAEADAHQIAGLAYGAPLQALLPAAEA